MTLCNVFLLNQSKAPGRFIMSFKTFSSRPGKAFFAHKEEPHAAFATQC